MQPASHTPRIHVLAPHPFVLIFLTCVFRSSPLPWPRLSGARRSSWWRRLSGLNSGMTTSAGAGGGALRQHGSRPARSSVLLERASRHHGLHQPAFLWQPHRRAEIRLPAGNNSGVAASAMRHRWSFRHAPPLVAQARALAPPYGCCHGEHDGRFF